MDTARIKGENIDLVEEEVLSFFEQRAQQLNTEHPLTSILYQDKNPELAEQRDREEKEIILPLMALTGKENVLDIGCGIGRWAKILYPLVKHYIGIDASEGLVKQAYSYIHSDNIEFFQVKADDLHSSTLVQNKAPFDLFVIAGLFIYLNDYQIQKVLKGMVKCLSEHATIYIREPFSVKGERLTLKKFWSEELSSNYSAIYRTKEEFTQLLETAFRDLQFEPIEFQPLFKNSKLNNRTETCQMYSVFRRK